MNLFNKFFLVSFSITFTFDLACKEQDSFTHLWQSMQQEYRLMNKYFCAKKFSDIKNSYVHKVWRDHQKKIGTLIGERSNLNFFSNPDIAGTMVRGGLGSTQLFEINFLKKSISQKTRDLLNKFNDIPSSILPHECTEFNCSVNTLGHLFYTAKILECAAKNNIKIEKIVEFGAGYGNLARIFKQVIPESTIIIFDVPEMIALQFLFLKWTLPEVRVLIHSRGLPSEFEQSAIHLVPVYLVQDTIFDANLFVSTFALSEATLKVQEAVAAHNFFNAELTYITGQINGFGDCKYYDVIDKSIKNFYSSVEFSPYHICIQNTPLYELIATH